VIARGEAFSLFSKWAKEETILYVDFNLSAFRFSVFGTLVLAEFPMVRLRLASLCSIDLYLPETTSFDSSIPDYYTRTELEGMTTGDSVYAVREYRETFLFVEMIVKT
jgi:hypothetical protein